MDARVWSSETPRRRWRTRLLTASGAMLLVIGAFLAFLPTVQGIAGQWSQQTLAVEADATSTRYSWATERAYGDIAAAFEDALVSFEIGARPRADDGAVIPSVAAATAVEARVQFQEPARHVAAEAGTERIEPAPLVTLPPAFPGSFIRIPSIDLDQVVVEGVSRADLRTGPGHYPGTAEPGAAGNMVISGHRTTYTRPFYDLDVLEIGALVFIETPHGVFEYVVVSRWIVPPDELGPLDATEAPTLTLTTCNPKGSARQRLIVRAELVEDAGV